MIWLLLLLTIGIALAWHRAGLRMITASYAALLLTFGVFGGSLALFSLGLLLFAGIFVPLSVPTLRQEWLTRPLLDYVQRTRLPIPAGFDPVPPSAGISALFGEGRPLQPAPTAEDFSAVPALLTPLRALQGQTDSAVFEALTRLHAFVPALPVEQGGLGLRPYQLSMLLMHLATSDAGARLARLILAYGGVARLLERHASPTQQAQWFPGLADGSSSLGLTTRWQWGASGVSPDRGVIGRGHWKGHECLGLTLDFDGCGIPDHGRYSDYLVRVHVRDPENLLGPEGRSGVALVRVPAALPGLQWRPGIKAADRQLGGRGLFVSLDHLVGGPSGIGQGDAALSTARTVQQAGELAIACGQATQALRNASLLTQIASFHHLAPDPLDQPPSPLADAMLDVYGLDTLRHLLARLIQDAGVSSDIATLASDAGSALYPRSVANRPTLRGPAFWPADGSTSNLDFSVRRLIESLLPAIPETLRAATAQPYGIALLQFDAACWPLLGEFLAHRARAGVLAISNGRAAVDPSDRHWQYLQRYRAALACCGDALVLDRRRGPPDGIQEAALRDAFAQTLALTAALQDHADHGHPRDQQGLLDAYGERCRRRIDAALDRFIGGQSRFIRRAWLRLLLLPLGRLTARAGDRRRRPLGALLLAPGPVRERLMRALPVGDAAGDAALRLEAALAAAYKPQQSLLAHLERGALQPDFPLEQIAEAVQRGLLGTEQAETLRLAHNLSEDWLQHADRASFI